MNKRTQAILDALDERYGIDVACHLHYKEPWQLLIATILSAQCTDARVNIVTKDLFVKYPGIEAFAKADITELEDDIRSIGFYHSKAKNIIACCQRLHTEYHDEIPSSIEDLTSLAGVGRKTANVIRGNIFHEPSIVVDTHVKRLAFRLGLTKQTDPVKVEKDLTKIIPYEYWGWIAIALILHGRQVCNARKPLCSQCSLEHLCPQKGVKISV